MARIKGKDIYLKHDDQVYFGDSQEAALWFFDNELRLDHTISGTKATQGYHLARLDQVPNDFLDLDDSPTTYSGSSGKYVRVNPNNPTELIFEDAIVGTTYSGSNPPDPNETNLWYNSSDNIFFYWDLNREKWLSTDTSTYLFTYSGNIDGLYLQIGTVTNSTAYYPIPRDSCIVYIIASADNTTNPTKGFEIRDGSQANASVFSFNLSDWEYSSMDIDVNLSAGAQLKCFCTDVGTRSRDPIVSIGIRRRYGV